MRRCFPEKPHEQPPNIKFTIRPRYGLSDNFIAFTSPIAKLGQNRSLGTFARGALAPRSPLATSNADFSLIMSGCASRGLDIRQWLHASDGGTHVRRDIPV